MTSIFERILYGIKVANDNIIVLNDKMDALTHILSCEDGEPNDVPAHIDNEIGDITN